MKNPFKGMFQKPNPYPVYLFTVTDYSDYPEMVTAWMTLDEAAAFIDRLGIKFEAREGNTYFETELFVKSRMDRDWILEELKREIDSTKRP